MSGTVVGIVAAVTLVMGVWALVTVIRDRPMTVPHVIGLGVVELVVLGGVGYAIVQLTNGGPPHGGLVTFIAYLVGVVLIPPVATGWGLVERTRWGPAVIIVACVAVAFMFVRMLQIWQGIGG
jgi:hypothetical protein